MAKTASTSDHRCKHCSNTIWAGEFCTWDRTGKGDYWHYNCQQPNQDPDIFGFPSRKSGTDCALGYNCKRPKSSRSIYKGDMIKSIGTNRFVHIECARPTDYEPPRPPQPTPNPYSTPTTTIPIVDTPTPTPTNNGATPNPTDDTAILNALVQSLSNFIDKSDATKRDTAQILEHLLARITTNETLYVSTTESIIGLEASIAALHERQPLAIHIHNKDTEEPTVIDIGVSHKNFPTVLKLMQDLRPEYRNIMLVGPASSGKSFAAKQINKALGFPQERYGESGAIFDPYALIGYTLPNGNILRTAFRDWWEFGGTYLLDEMDRSAADALIPINNGVSGGWIPFPNGLDADGNATIIMIQRHPQAYLLAGTNTLGLGGDSRYVTAQKLDAATLDRFAVVMWPIDPLLERAIVGNEEWVAAIQATRKLVDEKGGDFLITTRQAIRGDDLLRAGWTREDMVAVVFAQYRSDDRWAASIGKHIEEFVRNDPAQVGV